MRRINFYKHSNHKDNQTKEVKLTNKMKKIFGKALISKVIRGLKLKFILLTLEVIPKRKLLLDHMLHMNE